jgi:signal transduction histidine kinase/CheY-like chemotaxis protein
MVGSDPDGSRDAGRGSSQLTLVITVAAAVLIVGAILAVALLGLDTVRGVRAFVGAEGLWSKHQKDASHSLLKFARSTDPADFDAFRQHQGLIQDLERSRLELDQPVFDRQFVTEAFVGLGIDRRDVPSMIRLYRRFASQQQVAAAIDIWIDGDEMIEQLDGVAEELRTAVQTAAPQSEIDRLVRRVDANDDALRVLEDRFSAQLAEAADWANQLIRAALLGFVIVALAVILGLGVIGWKTLRRAEQYAADLEQQNWLATSRAELAAATTAVEDEQALDDAIIGYLTPRLGAQVGALFVAADDGRQRLAASYALASQDAQGTTFGPGEGLVGQAMLRREPILLSQVPEDCLRIQSGLTDATPRCIVVFPLADKRGIQAVLELASIDTLPERSIRFLELVGKDLALMISAARIRRTNERLHLETQTSEALLRAYTQELESNQEELRQSNAELEAQQRQLEEINTEVEEKSEELDQERRKVIAKNEALEEAKKELEAKAEELEKASRYKSEFLANMSHELRTPLNSIIVLSGLLAENKDDALSEKQVGFAQTICESGNHLVTLINDILDLSKIEAGRLDVSLETLYVTDLIAPIEHQFRPIAEEKGIALELVADDGVPDDLYTDGHRLAQVLRNLVSNAIKFTERGKVALSVRRPTPEEIEQAGIGFNPSETLAFSVTDSGIGIPVEQQRQIFEAFRQADGSTDRKYGGTGLGLAISRRLARLLGGEITLKSEPGEGSCFTVLVPTRAGAPPEALPTAPEPPAATEAPIPPKAVEPAISKPQVRDDRDVIEPGDRVLLIIEDDPAFAATLAELAREHAFKCVVANDGETGLDFVERYEPTAILLDLTLPGIDGMTVIARLKDNLATRHIPVHVVSGREQNRETLRAGALGYLRKPLNVGQLDSAFRRIEDLLSRRVKSLVVAEAAASTGRSFADELAGADVDIVVVSDGASALEHVRGRRVDCVVVGDELDDMSPAQLVERIRRGDENPETPVVAITSKEQPPEVLAALYRTADRVIEGGRHEARLLDETALFLHRVEKDLPEDKQRILRSLHDRAAILKGRKILIVDDDIRNVFALSSVLENEQMGVVIAKNGNEALSRLDEHQDIDLVLMDIMMPEMDGYEAMRRIRSNERLARLPIIALTAKAMRDDRAKCIEAGANDYLAKPVDSATLLSMMRVWLYARR